MRKRLPIVLGVLLLAVLGTIAWLSLRPDAEDPVYQGKRLSVWLGNYDPHPPYRSLSPEGEEAVRQLGTNAIPMLLRKLRAKASPFKDKLFALAQKQHVIKVSFTPAWFQHWQGALGFRVLAAEGKSAVPALIELYSQGNADPDALGCLSGSLNGIGPDARAAVPALIHRLGHTNERVRGPAAVALGQIHSEPQVVVPALISCLSDQNNAVRYGAASALSEFGPEAKAALPALTQLLADSDAGVRWMTKDAIKRIDPEAAAKAGVR
ncbi:MAG: repeat protein [Pedosphaera sp.]|nr:repeat protein [Pedosphaera sp.]